MLDTTHYHSEEAVLLLMGISRPTIHDTVHALLLLSQPPPPSKNTETIMSDEEVASFLAGMRRPQSENGDSASVDEVDARVSPNASTTTSTPLSPTASTSSSAGAASLAVGGPSTSVVPHECGCEGLWCKHANRGLKEGLEVLQKTSEKTIRVLGSVKAKTHILAAIVSMATGKVYGKRAITSRCQVARKQSTSPTDKGTYDIAGSSRSSFLSPLSPADHSNLLSLLGATVATQTPSELVARSFNKSISDDKPSSGRKRKAEEVEEAGPEAKVRPERQIKRLRLFCGSLR